MRVGVTGITIEAYYDMKLNVRDDMLNDFVEKALSLEKTDLN